MFNLIPSISSYFHYITLSISPDMQYHLLWMQISCWRGSHFNVKQKIDPGRGMGNFCFIWMENLRLKCGSLDFYPWNHKAPKHSSNSHIQVFSNVLYLSIWNMYLSCFVLCTLNYFQSAFWFGHHLAKPARAFLVL